MKPTYTDELVDVGADRVRTVDGQLGAAGRPWRTAAGGQHEGTGRVLPDCATTARRLRNDPRVPPRAKLAVGIALLWVLSPIDLIPEFLPVIGPLDDVVVVALAFRYAARQVPREVLLEAWPGKPSTIERVLGPAKPPPTVVR